MRNLLLLLFLFLFSPLCRGYLHNVLSSHRGYNSALHGSKHGGICDSSAMVAHQLPKLRVTGSNPAYRSKHLMLSLCEKFSNICSPRSTVMAWRGFAEVAQLAEP